MYYLLLSSIVQCLRAVSQTHVHISTPYPTTQGVSLPCKAVSVALNVCLTLVNTNIMSRVILTTKHYTYDNYFNIFVPLGEK